MTSHLVATEQGVASVAVLALLAGAIVGWIIGFITGRRKAPEEE